MKPLKKKLEQYLQQNSPENLLRVYNHQKLTKLGFLLKVYFKHEPMAQENFENLLLCEKRLFECFLKRKGFIPKTKHIDLTFERLQKYQEKYECDWNSDDKERLVFRFFDSWIKKLSFNKMVAEKGTKPRPNIKQNKNLKNKKIYLQVFSKEWVEDPVNKWSTKAPPEHVSQSVVPVDINKVTERNEHLKKFGQLFFNSPEARKQMRIFLRVDKTGKNSFFFNLVKETIDDKIDKKIKKFNSILEHVRMEDQQQAFDWFNQDVLSNKRAKLPTLFKDARKALEYFNSEYSCFLEN